MAEASLKLGGDWATKEGSLLGFNDQNGNYKPIPFDFTRATTATRVNRDGLIEEVQSGVPRIDFLDNSDGSLLLEPQRTNLLTYSELFSDAYWTKTFVTLTSNAATAPDGTVSADNFVATTDNTGNHRIYDFAGSSIQSATHSIFIKPNGHNYWALRESATTGASIGFDFTNNTIIVEYSTGGCTASNGKIEDYGNGWYRISGTFSFASATTQSFGLYAAAPTWASGDVESVPFAGDGTSGAYIWGAQLEAGSYPTSYIKTSGSAVTRNADTCEKTSASSYIGQTEGTIFWEINVETTIATANENILNIDDGSGFGNTIYFLKGAAGTLGGEMYVSSVLQASFTKTNITKGVHKMAMAYANNNTALFVDGVQIASTDTSCTIPSLSRIQLGNGFFGASDCLSNNLKIYKTRLTNTELAELTTL